MGQTCKIGVTVVIGFSISPVLFPFPVILSAALSLAPVALFSPYAVSGHKDEGDEQQHPGGDEDARYQELGGRVLSWERQQRRRETKEKGNRQKDRELENCNDRYHDRRFILVVKRSMRGKVRTRQEFIILKRLNTRTITQYKDKGSEFIKKRNCAGPDNAEKNSKEKKMWKVSSLHGNRVSLTIGQGAEDGCRTEAAVTGHGAHPHLHLILGGPAEVRQHGLVPVTLHVVALILTAPLLKENGELCRLEVSADQEQVRKWQRSQEKEQRTES